MNDVVFRRVNGRIVPIKKKEGHSVDLKKTASGAAIAAGGVVTGATAGTMAAEATKRAAKFRVNARVYGEKASQVLNRVVRRASTAEKLEKAGQMNFGFKIDQGKYNPYLKTAQRSSLASKGYRTLRKGFRYGGLAASTALISSGLKKSYEGLTGKKADTKEDVIATAAGASATFALSSSYAHRILGGGKQNVYRAFKYGLRAAKIKVP